MREWILSALDDIRNESDNSHTRLMCECGRHIIFPVVVREHDLDDLEKLLQAVHAVIDRYGINVKLLAEVRAQVAIAMANKKAAGRVGQE